MSQIKNAQIRYRVIDRCIRNTARPFPSKKELREACEEALYGSMDGANICDSTIEKDLFAMRMDHDAPIKYSKSKSGYYYADENYSIDTIPLTERDIQAIQFATNTLTQFRQVDVFQAFGSAIDKIVNHVHVATASDAKEYAEIIQFENGHANRGNEFIQPLLQAIRDQNFVSFEYTSYVTGKPKNRIALPLLLKEFRNRWYLICQDSEKNKIVTYALERMEDLTVSLKTGEIPKGFSAKEFFKYSTGITANEQKPEKILLKVSNVAAKYIASQPFHASQKTVKTGKKKTWFSLKVILSEEFIRDLMSYGGEIEVLEPATLRNEIITRIQQFIDIYQS